MTTMASFPVTQCPQCEGAIFTYGYGSTNTFGARYWTDMRQIAPMSPDHSMLKVCPHCDHLYWFDEVEMVGEVDSNEKVEDHYQGARHGNEPELEHYLRSVSMVADDPDKLEYVRIRIWWAGNDPRRGDESERDSSFEGQLASFEKHNLEELLPILATGDTGRQVLYAEALRELGRFDDCLAAIPEVENGPLADVANLIRGLAEKQDPLVAEILGEDW